jgi:hypothetical protein
MTLRSGNHAQAGEASDRLLHTMSSQSEPWPAIIVQVRPARLRDNASWTASVLLPVAPFMLPTVTIRVRCPYN